MYRIRYKRRRIRKKPKPWSSYSRLRAQTPPEMLRTEEPALCLEVVSSTRVSNFKAGSERSGGLASFRKCAADVSSLLAGKTERRGGGVFDQGHTAHGTTNDGPGGHHREPTAEKIAAGDVERSGHQPTRPCGESATQSTPVDERRHDACQSTARQAHKVKPGSARSRTKSSSSRQPQSSVGPGGL